MKEKKSKIYLIFLVLSILIVCIPIYVGYTLKSNSKKDIINEVSNISNFFNISKIYMYSSATATQNEASNKSTWNLNISQFTDIAIFIDNNSINRFN